ncbi:MAG: winged helix-turn-helix transcriptional regulator, partial [bacterium]|nr:winged helix-turn-helix transcriptional regulator [bacterium]
MAISPDDTRPPFRQIADDLRELIANGVIPPGTRLPSTRELMDRYDVANATAQSAIRVLRDENLVETVPARGTFVHTDLDITQLHDNQDDTSGDTAYGEIMGVIASMSAEITALT